MIDWLLDSDPSIRWQVMRDLMDESQEVVAGERSRVASEGWGSRLLDLQGPDGQWGGDTFCPHWIVDLQTLCCYCGTWVWTPRVSEPGRRSASSATTAPGDRNSTTHPSSKARSSPASTGGSSPRVPTSARRAIGWSIGSSASSWRTGAGTATPRRAGGPHSTRRSASSKGCWSTRRRKRVTAAVKDARLRGQEYLLERRMFRSLSNRKGDRSRLDPVFVSDSLALRRPVGPGLLAESWRRTRSTPRRGHRSGGEKARRPRAMATREPPRRRGPLRHGRRGRHAQPLEHTPRPYECWTGIRRKDEASSRFVESPIEARRPSA